MSEHHIQSQINNVKDSDSSVWNTECLIHY